jgi:hypothetical protein
MTYMVQKQNKTKLCSHYKEAEDYVLTKAFVR